ncbi:hypothetical protein [Nonomuraea sp. NPDC001699]
MKSAWNTKESAAALDASRTTYAAIATTRCQTVAGVPRGRAGRWGRGAAATSRSSVPVVRGVSDTVTPLR